MIAISWQAHTNAECSAYRVYRAITGIRVDFPNPAIAGTQLKVQATSPETQIIDFATDDINDFVDAINSSAKGFSAAITGSGDAVLIRTTAGRRQARFKLLPCSLATATLQPPRAILPEQEWELVGTVIRDDDETSYSFDDADGTFLDSYRITSFTDANYFYDSPESIPSLLVRPHTQSDTLCSLEGRVLSANNRSLAGVLVRARPYNGATYTDPNWHGQMMNSVRTDAYGRFQILLPRKAVYILEIQAIGYTQIMEVPDAEWARLIDVPLTGAHLLNPPAGDPA